MQFSVASLPDFDPNNRPRPLTQGDASDSPLFNRAVQGVYELGSTFKIFAAAQAVELGLFVVAAAAREKILFGAPHARATRVSDAELKRELARLLLDYLGVGQGKKRGRKSSRKHR